MNATSGLQGIWRLDFIIFTIHRRQTDHFLSISMCTVDAIFCDGVEAWNLKSSRLLDSTLVNTKDQGTNLGKFGDFSSFGGFQCCLEDSFMGFLFLALLVEAEIFTTSVTSDCAAGVAYGGVQKNFEEEHLEPELNSFKVPRGLQGAGSDSTSSRF